MSVVEYCGLKNNVVHRKYEALCRKNLILIYIYNVPKNINL